MTHPVSRTLMIIMGGWLLVSSALWTHSAAQSTNAKWTGISIISLAIVGVVLPRVRYVAAACAVWLWSSSFALPTSSELTVINSVLTAVVVFTLALVFLRDEARH